jgi:hypothetical protein
LLESRVEFVVFAATLHAELYVDVPNLLQFNEGLYSGAESWGRLFVYDVKEVSYGT